MTELWVRRCGDVEIKTIKVSTVDCKDIDDFKKAVQTAFPRLSKISRADLNIVLSDKDQTEDVLSPGTLVETLRGTFGFVNDIDNPLFVRVVEGLDGSVTKQLRCKRMSVEASWRKYFDAVARHIALYYDFDWKSKFLTVGDVLEAVKNGNWEYRLRSMTLEETTDKYGFWLAGKLPTVPKLNVPLNELLTQAEWVKLAHFNRKISDRIHEGQPPTTLNQFSYTILPHDDFTQSNIDFFKTLGVKVTLFEDRDSLVVKDEAFV